MRVFARSLAFVMLVVLTSANAYAQKGLFAAPKNADLERYPIFSVDRPLTVLQIAEMHLHPVKLTSPVVVQNHFRGLHGKEGRFVVEELPIGTLVLADENGNLRYKADCGNRLVEFDNTGTVHGLVSSIKLEDLPAKQIGNGLTQVNPLPPPTPTKPWLSRLGDRWNDLGNYFRRLAGKVWGLFYTPLWALVAGAGILALILLGLLIYWLLREIFGHQAETYNRHSYVPPPPAPPAAATVPPTPQPAAAATNPTGARYLHHTPENGSNPALIRTRGVTLHSVSYEGEDTLVRFRQNK